MELPKTKIAATRRNPKLLTIFGQSKVGKTTMLASLDDCLIIDTEEGSDMVDAMKVHVNSLASMGELYKALIADKKETGKNPYKFIALDTIDNLVGWIEARICKAANVTNLIDIPYGAGYNETRMDTMKWISRLKKISDHVILIGHRKKTIVNDESDITVETSSLELTGRLKNLVMADSDAIGYVFREKQEDGSTELKVSFVASDELECGARPAHLRGKVLPFEWDKIYVD